MLATILPANYQLGGGIYFLRVCGHVALCVLIDFVCINAYICATTKKTNPFAVVGSLMYLIFLASPPTTIPSSPSLLLLFPAEAAYRSSRPPSAPRLISDVSRHF